MLHIFKIIFRYLLFLLITITLNSCSISGNKRNLTAKYGLLDLTGWNFDQIEQIPLQGEWEFYWELLYSQQKDRILPERDPTNYSHYLTIPGVWNDKKIDNERLSGPGFATLRLQILLPETEKDLAISFPSNFYTVHAIWINGVKREWNGRPDSNPNTTNFFEHDLIEYLILDSKSIDLVVEIANFKGNTRWGGIRTPFYIGKVSKIRTETVKKYFMVFFIFSIILGIGIYHLSFFWNYQKDKLPIYFSFFCFVVSLYSFTTSSAWIVFFPKMDPNSLFKTEFFLELLLTPTCYLFLNYLFPKDFSKSLRIFLLTITTCMILIVLLLPIDSVSYFYKYSLYIPLIFGSYILIVVGKAYIIKRKFSGIILLSTGVLFVFMLNDVLSGLLNITLFFPYSFPLGLLLFISLHSHMISVRQAEAFKNTEDLVILQNKFNQQTKSQAEERSRIARDIHDSIGSEITAIMTYIGSENEDPQEAINKMKNHLSAVLINIRDIVYLLGQNKKEKDILEGEILKYINRLETSRKFKIQHEIDIVSTSLGIERSLNTQRIFLELMTNIIRHSKADQLRIQLTRKKNIVRLTIINNGIPFRWKPNTDMEFSNTGGFGMDGLMIRSQKMQAKIHCYHFNSINYSIVSIPI